MSAECEQSASVQKRVLLTKTNQLSDKSSLLDEDGIDSQQL